MLFRSGWEPTLLRYVLDETTVDKFVEYGVNVIGIDPSLDKFEIANKAIDETERFFIEELKIPANLTELNIDSKYFEKMAKKAVKGKEIKGFKTLNAKDVEKVYEKSQTSWAQNRNVTQTTRKGNREF